MDTDDTGDETMAVAIETPTVARCRKARTRLLGDKPWFGCLALRLGIHEVTGLDAALVGTAATDGTKLYVSDRWIAEQTDPVIRAVIAHEVLHCALEHPWRINGRDLDLFNQACDHVINLMLKAEGFELWEGALADR